MILDEPRFSKRRPSGYDNSPNGREEVAMSEETASFSGRRWGRNGALVPNAPRDG